MQQPQAEATASRATHKVREALQLLSLRLLRGKGKKMCAAALSNVTHTRQPATIALELQERKALLEHRPVRLALVQLRVQAPELVDQQLVLNQIGRLFLLLS